MVIFALRSSIFTGSLTLSRTSISGVYFRLDMLCVPEGELFPSTQCRALDIYYWHVGIRIFSKHNEPTIQRYLCPSRNYVWTRKPLNSRNSCFHKYSTHLENIYE